MALTTITNLPTPPSRQDSATFATRADSFLGALPGFVTQTNDVATFINDVQTEFNTKFLGQFADNSAAESYAASKLISLAQGVAYWNTTTNTPLFYTGSTWLDPVTTANTQASAAATSASNASTSESNAASSAGAASTSASNAATSETNAGKSKSDAQKIAVSAEDSQYTLSDGTTTGYSALHYKNKASASASAAATSASNAATSASAAATSASNAATSESNANTSKNAAASSASAAATSASNAATSASAAATSASNAATSESNASATLVDINKRFLLPSSVNPSTTGLSDGIVYYNTTANALRILNNGVWEPAAFTLEGAVTSFGSPGRTGAVTLQAADLNDAVTIAKGGLLYGSAANTYSALAAGTDGQVLKLSSGVPTWQSVLSGITVPVANGGVGFTSYAGGDIIYASGTNTLSKLSKGSNGQVLKLINGLPAWSTDDNTTYTTATSSSLGLVKLGSDTIQSVATNGVSANAGRTYAVQLNSSNQMVVNVPWQDTDTNTTYSTATASTLGLVKIGYTENGQNYPVELSSGQMYVNVPWVNTTYSTATSSTLGLVKTGYTENGQNYPVELSNGQMYVNVPWVDTNTTYSEATSTTYGLVKTGYAENGQNYPVELSSGKMYVNVPWIDTNTTYSAGNGLSLSGTQFLFSGQYTGTDFTLYNDTNTVDSHCNLNFKSAFTNNVTTGAIHDTGAINFYAHAPTGTERLAAQIIGTAVSFNLGGLADDTLGRIQFNTYHTDDTGTISTSSLFIDSNSGGGTQLKASNNLDILVPTGESISFYAYDAATSTTWRNVYISGGSGKLYAEYGISVNGNSDIDGNLDVSGNITAYSTNISSDAKLKTNVAPIKDSLNKIKQLVGVEFDWIKNGEHSAGVIAQDVEKVIPCAVSDKVNPDTEETSKVVNYNALFSIVIEAIKELDSKLQQIENKLQ